MYDGNVYFNHGLIFQFALFLIKTPVVTQLCSYKEELKWVWRTVAVASRNHLHFRACSIFYTRFEKVSIAFWQMCAEFGEWSPFGDCSVTCGGGMRERERDCITDENRLDDECMGAPIEFQPCNSIVIILLYFFDVGFCFEPSNLRKLFVNACWCAVIF